MKELSKDEILKLVTENLTDNRFASYKGFDEEVEMGEMAQAPEKFPKLGAPDPSEPTKRSKGEIPKWTRLYASNEQGELVEHVGWYHYSQDENQIYPILISCDWDELIGKHPDLIEKIKEKYGSVYHHETKGGCPTDVPFRTRSEQTFVIQPAPGQEGIEIQVKSGSEAHQPKTTQFTRTLISTEFYKILRDHLENNPSINNKLKQLSLPKIIVGNTNKVSKSGDTYTEGEGAKHRNQYTTINNEEITFQSHNVNVYETQKQFIQDVLKASKTKDPDTIPEKENKHIRRLNNPIYTNYPVVRPLSAREQGKTPVFKLDKSDFPNDKHFEVLVYSTITVTGKPHAKNDDGLVTEWGWTINYSVEYAKKAPSQREAEGLSGHNTITQNEVVKLSEPKQFDGKTEFESTTDERGNRISNNYRKISPDSDKGTNHPLSDINVKSSLEKLLTDFEEKVGQIPVAKSVQMAVTKVKDVGGEGRVQRPELPQMNEGKKKK